MTGEADAIVRNRTGGMDAAGGSRERQDAAAAGRRSEAAGQRRRSRLLLRPSKRGKLCLLFLHTGEPGGARRIIYTQPLENSNLLTEIWETGSRGKTRWIRGGNFEVDSCGETPAKSNIGGAYD
jgi:hypothetical protein